MSMGNNITVVGNATRDPELRFTRGGKGMCSFGVAYNRKWKNKQTDEWEESVSFFDVQVWGDLAENVAQSVTKGMRVVVVGALEQRSWETDAGEKRTAYQINADEVSPSLRWATAVVTRNERDSDGGGRGRGSSGGGGSRSSSRRSDAGGGLGGGSGYDMDEEPFVVPAASWWPEVGLGSPPSRLLP